MSATIYDIAKKAGVSIATVSRVFNHSDSVSKKTRDKVLKIADKIGYHPQANASGLASKQSNVIMVIVPVISNYFFMEVLEGIQDKLSEHQYDLNIYNVTTEGSILDQVEHVLKRRMAEGYIMVSIHLNANDWQQLIRYDVPVALVDEYYSDFDSVSVDSVEGAYIATRHLLEAGHRRIAMIAAKSHSKPVRERLAGFKRAVQEYGLMFEPDLILNDDLDNRDGFTEKAGYTCMQRLLSMEHPPEACLCTADVQAIGALKAMREKGGHMPIISFDDIAVSEYIGLSTMRQPMYDMGFLATQKLIDRITNRDAHITHTIFSPQLILRDNPSTVNLPV